MVDEIDVVSREVHEVVDGVSLEVRGVDGIDGVDLGDVLISPS